MRFSGLCCGMNIIKSAKFHLPVQVSSQATRVYQNCSYQFVSQDWRISRKFAAVATSCGDTPLGAVSAGVVCFQMVLIKILRMGGVQD